MLLTPYTVLHLPADQLELLKSNLAMVEWTGTLEGVLTIHTQPPWVMPIETFQTYVVELYSLGLWRFLC